MPVTLGQELSAWATQIRHNLQRIDNVASHLQLLAIGGTAVGTGINAPVEFGAQVAQLLTERTAISFMPNPNRFESLSAQDTAVELSGQLRVIAVSLMKISNDLRWMNSGPLAGIGEIVLPALQPGSSIMPGKVNPVIPEAVAMVCAQVMGNDHSITIAAQSGNFQLNVMLPIIAYNLLQNIEILSHAAKSLADNAIAGFKVQHQAIEARLSRNPVLVTALNRVIGYELGAKIAKAAYSQNRPLREVAAEMTELSPEQLDRLLDPQQLTQAGIRQ
jgi:fumarate hydratase class II